MIKTSRLIEGILTYLNALLILDLARKTFEDKAYMAVIIIAILTLLIIFLHNSRESSKSTATRKQVDESESGSSLPFQIIPLTMPLPSRTQKVRST
ncbi:MAG: hypothetical protein WC919_07590 [Candidatus Paceibacterota bacterium]|jgi:hypothetical protein